MTAPVILRGAALYRQLLTHHEAGHVAACTKFDISFDHVALETGLWGGLTGGYVNTTNEVDPERIDSELIVYFAGRAAEERWLELHPGHGEVRPEGDYEDFRIARKLMAEHENSGERKLRLKAAALVDSLWLQIVPLAGVLAERKRLSAAAAKRASKK